MLFADFINWAIEQSGVTNYKLAKRLNVSQTTIANWCNGVTEPREKKRAQVLSLFGVDEFDLEQGFPDVHLKEDLEKKEKLPGEGELTGLRKDAWDLIERMDDDTLKKFIKVAKAMLGD